MSVAKTINHNGRVVAISKKQITVAITSMSACSSCHAKGACTSVDSKERELVVPNLGEAVAVGDEVDVSIQLSMGYQAVLFAFVLPLVLLLTFIFLAQPLLGVSEGLAGLVGLGSLVPYFVVLYLLRDRLNKKFIFHIEKL